MSKHDDLNEYIENLTTWRKVLAGKALAFIEDFDKANMANGIIEEPTDKLKFLKDIMRKAREPK